MGVFVFKGVFVWGFSFLRGCLCGVFGFSRVGIVRLDGFMCECGLSGGCCVS